MSERTFWHLLTWARPVIRGTGIVFAFAISFLKPPPELEEEIHERERRNSTGGNVQNIEIQEILVVWDMKIEQT